MKKLKRYIFLLCALLLLMVGCKDESPVVLLVKTDAALAEDCAAGYKMLFAVEAFANVGNLKKVTITEKSGEFGSVKMLDTLLNETRVEFDFGYTVKSFTFKQKVTLAFEASNTKGDVFTITRSYNVSPDGEILVELSGNTLYTALSGKADGYSLTEGLLITARASAARCCCPPESWLGLRDANSLSRTVFKTCSDRKSVV
jgi:hypothetical protein